MTQVTPTTQLKHVNLFQISFPLLSQHEALEIVNQRYKQKKSTLFSFLDMSAINIMKENPDVQEIYQNRSMIFNDGAGLAFAAWTRGVRFPANLNGTDFIPLLLESLPIGTRVFLIGATAPVIEKAHFALDIHYEKINIVGSCHGFFSVEEEKKLLQELHTTKPEIILVGMGNPFQVRFINRHLNDSQLTGIQWFAIGGFFNFCSGTVKRAPVWMRNYRLEWVWVILQQPHKTLRYLWGIPQFIFRCFQSHFLKQHDI